MYCNNCGARLLDGDKFCRRCGYDVDAVEHIRYDEPVTEYKPLYDYKPVSPWALGGLFLLFSIPGIGWILCIILSFSRNMQIMNFARSMICAFLIALGFIIAVLIIGGATGTTDELLNLLEGLGILTY